MSFFQKERTTVTNKFFEEETITKNDLFFICYMVERVARKIHQSNAYVIDTIGYENLETSILKM